MRGTDYLNDEPQYNNMIFEKIPSVDPELAKALQGLKETSPATDKNTPESLKKLRWAIYEAVDNYSRAIVMGPLKMQIEELFKKYTNS